jgi:hypothetical protein
MPPHILVAEDQADIRDLLVMNLRGAGYDVAAVADGAAALASQAEQRSDLLILDLMMPALDGLEIEGIQTITGLAMFTGAVTAIVNPSPRALDYALPRAADLPRLDLGLRPTACTTNPLGIKGCGEAGCSGSLPAVMNAVNHALRQAGGTTVDMPATPQAVWRALNPA